MDKRTKKNSLVIIILIIGTIFISVITGLSENQYYIFGLISIVDLIILLFFIIIIPFIIFARKKYIFKPYFISKFNFLTSKVRIKKEVDLPKELLFEKMIEVVNNSGYKIKQKDKITGDIFATSSISWQSWGENIYISIVELNGKSNVEFISACIFQVYDWGKNERNLKKILQEFEDSLTI